MNDDTPVTEVHPWPPFMPTGARVLVMGTFPPQPKRWCMDFYYPNRTNDFWYMMGLIFFGDKNALLVPGTRDFDLAAIKRLLTDRGIALHDTCRQVRRLKGNASDKYLEIVEPVSLRSLLSQMPLCKDIAATGEKAASVIATLTGTAIPKTGEMTIDSNGTRIWRMPSTSRAYPLALDKKAGYYTNMFRHIGIL